MKVGTRVRALTTNRVWRKKGELGTIVKIKGKFLLPIEIKWDSASEKDGTEPCSRDEFEVVKTPRQATLEIYKTKKGLSYRKIASNGKILNHQYNTMAGLKKGIEAEKRFWENYKIVTK